MRVINCRFESLVRITPGYPTLQEKQACWCRTSSFPGCLQQPSLLPRDLDSGSPGLLRLHLLQLLYMALLYCCCMVSAVDMCVRVRANRELLNASSRSLPSVLPQHAQVLFGCQENCSRMQSSSGGDTIRISLFTLPSYIVNDRVPLLGSLQKCFMIYTEGLTAGAVAKEFCLKSVCKIYRYNTMYAGAQMFASVGW